MDRQQSTGIRDYQDLVVWQRAMELAEAVYAATQGFAGHETFGLTSQLRRCAVSVPSNIAEGNGRRTRRDFTAFLYIARGAEDADRACASSWIRNR